eukprot:g18606.t1
MQRQHLNATLRNISTRTGAEVEQAVDAVLTDCNATNVRLRHRVRQLETERTTLVSSLRQNHLTLERERADRSTQQAALEDQVQRHHTQVTNQVGLIQELETQALASTQRAARSREQVLSRNSRIDDLGDNVAELKAEGEELQEQLRIKVEECHDLSEVVDELRKENLSLHNNVGTHRTSLEAVQEKLSNAEYELALVRSKLESLPPSAICGGVSSSGTSEDPLTILEDICDRNNYLVEELDAIKYNLKWYKDYHDYWIEQENSGNRTESTWVNFGSSGTTTSPPASEGPTAENATEFPNPVTTTPFGNIDEETSAGAGPSSTSLPVLQLFPPLQLGENIESDTFLSFDAARGFLATHTPLTIEEVSSGAGSCADTEQDEVVNGVGSVSVCGDCEACHPLVTTIDGQQTTVAEPAASADLLNQSTESAHTCRSFVSTPPTESQLALLDQDLPNQDLLRRATVPNSTLLSSIFPVPNYQSPIIEERVHFGPAGDSEHIVVGWSGAGVVDEDDSNASRPSSTSGDSSSTSESNDSESESDSSFKGESTDSGDEPRSRRVLKKRIRFYRRAKIRVDKVTQTERARNTNNSQAALRQFDADKDRLYHKLRGEERTKTGLLRRRVQELSSEKKYWEERATSTAEARDRHKTQNDELLHRVADLECKLRDTGGVRGNSGWEDPSSWYDRRNWWNWGWRD